MTEAEKHAAVEEFVRLNKKRSDEAMASTATSELARPAAPPPPPPPPVTASGDAAPIGVTKADRREAFVAFLRNGGHKLNKAQRDALGSEPIRNAAAIGLGLAGGFLVPEAAMAAIVEAQRLVGGMLTSGAEIIDTPTGATLPVPMNDDTANLAQIILENASMADAPALVFTQMELGAYCYISQPLRVSQQLVQDTALELDTYIAARLGTRIARAANVHFTVGTGMGQPWGVVPRAVQSGNGIVLNSGETQSIQPADIENLIDLVDPAYLPNARFMLHSKMLTLIRKMVDTTGRPIWMPSMVEGQQGLIWGYPYTLNQAMPTPGANAVTILFGDFSAYKIRRVKDAGIQRLSERYADVNQIGFIGSQRWDGNLADAGTHPIAYLQQSAS